MVLFVQKQKIMCPRFTEIIVRNLSSFLNLLNDGIQCREKALIVFECVYVCMA